jgi:crotonobetainyl-CoA:carnitine CoA-transferase CaiB-like acyl-CoA transferase
MLDGCVVVEMAQVITGPMAGMLLAELGAEVIKVEDPLHGDAFRGWHGGGDSSVPAHFAAFNRGKTSVALDTATEAGQDAYRELVAGADVVIENFRPGVMDRSGIGYAQLRRSNPRLVYCHITGMGSRGPRAHLATYDGVAQALSGLWSQFTDMRQPQAVGPALADQLCAQYAAMGVLAALVERGNTGEGQLVEVDMLSSCLAFQTLAVTEAVLQQRETDASSRARASLVFGFVAADGLPFCIHLSSRGKFWEALCGVVGHDGLTSDPRFATKRDRTGHYDELHAALQEAFAGRTRADSLSALESAGVPCGPINTIAEAVHDPQVRAIDAVGSQGPASPIISRGRRMGGDRPAPELGDGSDTVLATLGGRHDR